ncbi:site-specific integrase [Bacteroides eggerthii]|jgi:site-specific recombinase XerD|uniref:site-specific integrase n=1 Tax=Bacteroides eggerthii TaxID=28111 RepID=UPI001C376D9D|nr:site-specific integrase [Bacteroides eggerthii]MBV3845176.1 site-specific integrase [Bacteroides eggerthii]MBV3848090.1 site-specific integrase [Bacteroides eggerthii]MBV3886270.1 site-specific integrase [Bacteroides eggerthii]MBV3893227.1 site-specific integrase [Bacteroides eggerthii]MBV3904380.1 site-specific integrase [Bacteroides eggerthii]
MNKIIYNLVYNRKKCLNKKGMALVQVEAYLGRKKKYFSTKVYLKPEQWDNKKLFVKNHPNADALNRLIYEFVATIEKKELELWQQGKRISLELLKNALTTQENNSSFISFFRQEVMNSSLKDSTKRNHLSTLMLLQEFKKNITFSDLTFELISSFEYFLQLKGYHTNTIAKHMKHLKRHVNIAINKEYIEIQKYAFRKYKIKTIENKHTHLVPEELERLENLILSGRYVKLQKSLDAFLFCCYAGMRYSDFINLSSENFVDINQETWLIYKSVKTGTEVRLPLYLLFSGKGIAILNKYRDNLEDFFHLRDNSNVNKDLIIITRLAGLSKRISFHTARHTNATLLIYNGINITTVQKLLGHKSVKTTQVYTNVMDMTIIHDLEKMK